LLVQLLFYFFVLFSSAAIGGFISLFENTRIDIRQLEQERITQPSLVFDDKGQELFRFALDKRTPITSNKIPDIVTKAFVAAEDHNFFSHCGVSIKGIVRSTFVNLYYRRIVQGASTITQQVARLLFLSHEKTIWRKFYEIILAIQLEQTLTKDQILQYYVNNIYFGRGIYGVEAAAQRFWNKSTTQVTLDEAAILAAIAKSARFYSPLNAPLTARKRRNTILNSMCCIGFITKKERQIAQEKPIVIENHIEGNPIRLYIQEWIRSWAEQKWGKETLYNKGLKIKTTINRKMQTLAEESFSKIATNMRTTIGEQLNGGMITIHTTTGKIKNIIGGLDFRQSQFNRAFQAYRQVGSSFKPLLYALALKEGYDMNTTFIDEPIEIKQANGEMWRPRNWTRKYEGSMTLLRALTFSNNIIAIKLLLEIGSEKLIAWLKLFGITRELTPYPTLALGTAHVSVQENAAAFNVFANNGVYVEPHLIEWVKDEWGKKIWNHKSKSHRILDSKINSKMVKALTYRMKIAKKRCNTSEDWLDGESIGKTGSTDGAATVWFVGSTPEYTSAVYLGRDDNKHLGHKVYANKTAFPIWKNFAQHFKSNTKKFYLDPALQKIRIDWWSGEEVSSPDHNTVTILK
jgi:penicillin-binding protein 1A